MYLEDAEENKQFLLSELIDYVETQLKNYMPVDWTSFTQRKSLVRVLQYMERLQMLRVYEGKSESFSLEAGQEVLYENTGYSKYFTSSFTTDISGYESWRDFEKTDFEEFEENRGSLRINRVYRQLAICPAFYWNGAEDADALYLKNQRGRAGKYFLEKAGDCRESRSSRNGKSAEKKEKGWIPGEYIKISVGRHDRSIMPDGLPCVAKKGNKTSNKEV